MYVAVNFLPLVIFVFLLFLGIVMYGKEVDRHDTNKKKTKMT